MKGQIYQLDFYIRYCLCLILIQQCRFVQKLKIELSKQILI